MFGTLMMASSVSIILLGASTKTDPPATQLSYKISNSGDYPIWLVDDNWLVWKQHGKQIELSYAREKMQPGVQVFGYFKPKVKKVAPGKSVIKKIELKWPVSLDQIWNASNYASPKPGRYSVSIKVGYGLTPEPEPVAEGENVETPVLRWQMTIVSEVAMMDVPNYNNEK